VSIGVVAGNAVTTPLMLRVHIEVDINGSRGHRLSNTFIEPPKRRIERVAASAATQPLGVEARPRSRPALLLSLAICGVSWAANADAAADSATAPSKPASAATGTAFQSHGPYLKRHVTYTVNRDGTYVREYESIARADNEDGVKEWSQVRVPYSSSLQKAEVLEAYVLTSTGERIEVSPNKIFTQEPYVSQGAPMYSDYKVKTIVFPKVEPGTTVGGAADAAHAGAAWPVQRHRDDVAASSVVRHALHGDRARGHADEGAGRRRGGRTQRAAGRARPVGHECHPPTCRGT
jgi:hypothetical protein